MLPERESRPHRNAVKAAPRTDGEKVILTVRQAARIVGLKPGADPTCPYSYHTKDLKAARLLWRCKWHGCVVCADNAECEPCMTLRSALYRLDWPETQADPWCIAHGVPTPETTRSCPVCAELVARARLWGWTKPTGHDGEDCLHCIACGLCKASGRVCRHCGFCDRHHGQSAMTETCWGSRRSRITRQNEFFHAGSYWRRDTRTWDL